MALFFLCSMDVHFEKYDGHEYINYTDPLDRDITLIKKEGKLVKIVDSLFRQAHSITPNSAKFFVVGDMHGHIAISIRALKGWEQFSGIKTNQILQVGDMGAASYNSEMDKATAEMAKKDASELDFLHLHHKNMNSGEMYYAEQMLKDRQIYFPNGNHDDELFLYDNYFKETPNDKDYFRYIPTGKIIDVLNNGRKIRIAGIGYNNKREFKDTKGYPAEILLTHTPAKNTTYPYGNEEITKYIKEHAPLYHFFGHARNAAILSNPEHNSYGLNAVYNPKSGIQEGSIGFLDINNNQEHKFIYIPEQILNDMSKLV